MLTTKNHAEWQYWIDEPEFLMAQCAVHQQCPDQCQQKDAEPPWCQRTAVNKERQMGTQHNWQSLSQVPVPGVRAVKCSQILQHVEFQEVQLNQYPLGDMGEVKQIQSQTQQLH